ncbi:MAG: cation transporter dimerization domain-containing protein, partial [Candidatus Helarchaeota archaeon]
ISNLEILIHAEPYQDVREEELLHEIKRIIENISVVQDCHNIRVRVEKDEIIINLHVSINREMSFEQAHQISTIIEKISFVKLQEKYQDKKFDIYIHLKPKKVKNDSNT